MMLRVSKDQPAKYPGDLLVYLVRQSETGVPVSGVSAVDAVITRAHAAGGFLAKESESLLFYPENLGGKAGPKRILVMGLGKAAVDGDLFRKAGGSIAQAASKSSAGDLLLVVPEGLDIDGALMAQSLAEGLILGSYRFKKYKAVDPSEPQETPLKKAAFYAPWLKGLSPAIKLGTVAANAACRARDMAHEPASHWTPEDFAKYARKLAAAYELPCTILDGERMQRLGMGGIISVNQGSALPPRLIILEYGSTADNSPTLLLVGKGLTFDSGGISLKPSSGMEEMKYDMCGGAAVLCALQAVAEARLKGVRVVTMVPATENLPGPAAVKPGDLIRQYGGKTVEVVNTDAEGRLILADALAYGIEKYKPDAVIDLATLTGAVIIGLGHHRTGLFSNDEALSERLLAAGERTGEPLWRLPLGPEYTKQLKSEIADLKNVGKRDGGAITAASFLKEFVGDTPWAHLDIAGTAWDFTEKSYIPKGPSGIMVRTLFDLVRNWSGPSAEK